MFHFSNMVALEALVAFGDISFCQMSSLFEWFIRRRLKIIFEVSLNEKVNPIYLDILIFSILSIRSSFENFKISWFHRETNNNAPVCYDKNGINMYFLSLILIIRD